MGKQVELDDAIRLELKHCTQLFLGIFIKKIKNKNVEENKSKFVWSAGYKYSLPIDFSLML